MGIEPTTIFIPEVTVPIKVTTREVGAKLNNLESFKNNSFIEKNEDITLEFLLVDKNGQKLVNIGYKGNSWKATVELADPENYGGASIENQSFQFDEESGISVTNGMKITETTDYYRYNFKITIYTEPEVYKPIVLYTPSVRVYSNDNQKHENTTTQSNYKMKLKPVEQTSVILSDETILDEDIVDDLIASTFNNFLVDLISGKVSENSYVENVLATTIGGNTELEFSLTSTNMETSLIVQNVLESKLKDSTFTYMGDAFASVDPDCYLEIEGTCRSVTSSKPEWEEWQTGLVASGCAFAVVAIFGGVTFKNKHKNNVHSLQDDCSQSFSESSSPSNAWKSMESVKKDPASSNSTSNYDVIVN